MHITASLPTGFSYARDLAFVGELPEADTAHAEVPEEGVRPAANAAAVISAGGKFGLRLLL
jgi:hypothetical protein